MKQYEIRLNREVAIFYERIAFQAGRDVEQVLNKEVCRKTADLLLYHTQGHIA